MKLIERIADSRFGPLALIGVSTIAYWIGSDLSEQAHSEIEEQKCPSSNGQCFGLMDGGQDYDITLWDGFVSSISAAPTYCLMFLVFFIFHRNEKVDPKFLIYLLFLTYLVLSCVVWPLYYGFYVLEWVPHRVYGGGPFNLATGLVLGISIVTPFLLGRLLFPRASEKFSDD